VLGLAGGLIAVIICPWLVEVMFNAQRILGPADFGLLAAGTLFYMLAMVLGQAAMALSRHRDQLLAWIAGAAVLIAITVVPGEVKLRVEAAYALSSVTVALTLAFLLFRLSRRGGTSAPASSPAAVTLRGRSSP
jgi:O-antigen/teichoic acid export membrane protein